MAKLPNRSHWDLDESTPLGRMIRDGGATHIEEHALAAYAYHDSLVAEVNGYLEQGDDAIGWAEFGRDYRTIIAECETRVAELEAITAATFRSDIESGAEASVVTRALWEWEAKAAERRAANAEQRRALVLGDNDERHASDELWTRMNEGQPSPGTGHTPAT